MGTTTSIQITEHTWKEQVEKLDVTASGMGGLQALLAGIFRGEGQVKGNVNTALVPWANPPFIVAGANGMLVLGLGTNVSGFSIPGMITEVSEQDQVAGVVNYTFNVALNFLAGTGVYARAL